MVALVLLQWMHHKFMRTGIFFCIAHTDSHFQIMGQVYSKIQLLLVFHSGSNKGLLEALEVAKARGAKIIADYEL